MKTILVPTDFSAHAYYALKTAASIAQKINAKIMLVHVCALSSSDFAESFYYKKFFDQYKAQTEAKLDKLLSQKILKGLVVSKHIVVNMSMREWINDEKYKNVDLIVVGSHGISGFDKVFIGSNTEKIIRMANVPVLTVKKEFEDFHIRKMVFASDFYKESYPVYEKIKFFADLYHAQIDYLKVITPKNFESTPMSEKLLEDFAEEFQLSRSSLHIYNATSIEKGITDFSNEKEADMIALGTHGRTGIAHLISGSLAENVALHQDRSVLSVKVQEHPMRISGFERFVAYQEKEEAERAHLQHTE